MQSVESLSTSTWSEYPSLRFSEVSKEDFISIVLSTARMGSIPQDTQPAYDVLIIGAGLSGVCSLYHIRKRFPTWRVKVLEAGTDVGGVWYWNRYPGCQIDTESLSYCFSFDKELLQEWEWTESFAKQPETQRYIKRVTEKHEMEKDMKFNTRIKSAHWNDRDHTWTFFDEEGEEYVTRFFVSCLGFLSSPTLPKIPGIADFRGKAFHTSRWPGDIDISRDFAGKKIGIIGTGATGIQTISALSKDPSLGSLSVFQRTANWSAPLRNTTISAEEMMIAKGGYDAIFQRCATTPAGFLHEADPRKSLEVTPEARVEHWEKLYNSPGFGKWLGVFSDTYTDREANDMYSAFMADKIRQRVRDPLVAESLIPKNHGFGTRRVPLETGYFEAFNKDNVHLVDLQKTPISRVTNLGIETDDGQLHELDILIFATGFDAITGAFGAIDWHAKDGRPLIVSRGSERYESAIWPDHRPKTFLGLSAPAMPNMLMVLGPHQPFGNGTRSIEHASAFICDMLAYCHDKGYTYFEPTTGAVDLWTEHVFDCGKTGLMNEIDSWMTGVNKNVEGKTERTVARYAGSAINYRKWCADCKEKGYEGFVFLE
ncbi:cyclohexanone monooxygenase [Cucurbitaria berberidis CBS 394.84]|uniref:Cyclohexanone monooxygenase n=1 Tax=Cucurbitaria berberidis CBS 394.84 TaxID=1168544 RepID=A0A9P4LB65_9PLEO|nr:cyclohexanone monooxygenase [Cucurbitaria berberidis CBS 394.84]KAF1847894.1 cyclohexanone monooxygenase [Cucurbitaria berberidis CBS 394.84]